jgi:hypothetical protein
MAFVQSLTTEARRIASEDVRLHARRDGLQLAGAFLLFNGLFRSYRPLPQKNVMTLFKTRVFAGA